MCTVQVSSNTLPPYFGILFLAFLLGVWSLVSIINGLGSGWHALSKRFRAQSKPYGKTKSAEPFYFGVYTRFWTDYSGFIRMTSAADALYLSVIFPLRIGHPPLCIPWNEISISRTNRLWLRLVVL